MILNSEIWDILRELFNSLAHHPQFCATVYEVLYSFINILQHQSIDMLHTDSDGISDDLSSPALKCFKLLSARVSTEISTCVACSETPQIQLTKYIS